MRRARATMSGLVLAIATVSAASVTASDMSKSLGELLDVDAATAFQMQAFLEAHPACLTSGRHLTDGIDLSAFANADPRTGMSRNGIQSLVRLRANARDVLQLNATDVAAVEACVHGLGPCDTILRVVCRTSDPWLHEAVAARPRGQAALLFVETVYFATLLPPASRRRAEEQDASDMAVTMTEWLPMIKTQMEIAEKSIGSSTSPGVAKSIRFAMRNATDLAERAWTATDVPAKVRLLQSLRAHYEEPLLFVTDVMVFLEPMATMARAPVLSSDDAGDLRDFAITGTMNAASRRALDGFSLYVNEEDDRFWYPAFVPVFRGVCNAHAYLATQGTVPVDDRPAGATTLRT